MERRHSDGKAPLKDSLRVTLSTPWGVAPRIVKETD